jgi:hypothetical protein
MQPTAYGDHLALLLRAALAQAPGCIRRNEQVLAARFQQAPRALRDLLARLAERVHGLVKQTDIRDDLAELGLALAWLQETDCRQEPDRVAATCSLSELALGGDRQACLEALQQRPDLARTVDHRLGPWYRLSDTAEQLVAKARFLTWGSDTAGSDLVRIAMGHLLVPDGSPMAALLRGSNVTISPNPWRDAATLEDFLLSREIRTRPSDMALLQLCKQALIAHRGEACLLRGQQHRSVHQLSRCLWRCYQELQLSKETRRQVLELMATIPLAPALAREWARASWREATPLERARIAADCATWAIWRNGERERWRLRASGKRRGRAEHIWRQRHLVAWLDHDQAGRVIAEGERVEACALRALQAEGWQGLHAEGSVWAGLCLVLAWPLLRDSPTSTWHTPGQALPDDWRAWGFAAARRRELGHLRRQLLNDPLAALRQGWSALGLDGLPTDQAPRLAGIGSLPCWQHLVAIASRLPARMLAAIIDHLLRHPGDQAGLPDLIVWNDNELALWEVKSPGDQLSDEQIAWLTRLVLEDIPAGVLRLDARRSEQLSLLPTSEQHTSKPARKRRQTTRPRRRPSKQARSQLCAILLPDERVYRPGARLGDDRWWHRRQADFPVGVPIGNGANPWQVLPIDLLGYALRLERHERWFLLPRAMPAHARVRPEATDSDGLQPQLQIGLRRSGWLVPGELLPVEVAVFSDPAADPLVAPMDDPKRADRCAEAWQLRDALDQQLALIGTEGHALQADPEQHVIRILLPPNAGVLWLDLPGLQRVDAPWLVAQQ